MERSLSHLRESRNSSSSNASHQQAVCILTLKNTFISPDCYMWFIESPGGLLPLCSLRSGFSDRAHGQMQDLPQLALLSVGKKKTNIQGIMAYFITRTFRWKNSKNVNQ